MPERVIQGITGHRSIMALRQYEKVSDVQKKAACNILTGRSVDNYRNEVEKLPVQPDRGHRASSSASNDEVVKRMGGFGNSAMPLQLGAYKQ